MSKSKLINLEVRENRKELEEIAERAGIILSEENHIDMVINNEPNYTPLITFAYSFMSETISYLEKKVKETIRDNDQIDGSEKDEIEGLKNEINVFDLFTIGISFKEFEDGEKDGNFTPYVVPGPEFINLLEKAMNNPANSNKENEE